GRLDFDLSGAVAVDGAIMSLLVDLRASLAARGVESEIIGASDRVRSLVHLYRGDEPPLVSRAPRRERALGRLGRATEELFADFVRLAVFLGNLVAALARTVRVPASLNWR